MKVALISAFDKANGSARAAYRLQQGLRLIDVNSQMIVQEKGTADSHVLGPKSKLAQGVAKARITFDGLPLKLYRQRDSTLMSLQWVPDNLSLKIRRIDPDIINLHWANDAFLKIETLARLNKPVIWSLHDMWPFTGGCHYTQECDRYLHSCGSCPQLGSHNDLDLSRWIWRRKRKAFPRCSNLTIVGLSSWMADCARQSSLLKDFRIEVIHNGIDIEAYKPIDQIIARQILGLPQDKKLVLSGALSMPRNKGEDRKGFHLLRSALKELSQNGWHDKLDIMLVGASRSETVLDFSLKTHFLGRVADDLTLALIYSAADLFVAPSVQENLANTVMESLACGTPCVAFNIGGMPDMIEHQTNGYLAHPFQTQDLAHGIVWILENQDRHQKLSHHARQKVKQEFSLDIQAYRYKKIFNEVLRT